MEPTLRIVPLGGLGRVGGNMMVYETERDLIIVDCGVLFPTTEQPGVDYVIPDVTYVVERKHKLRGIVLTHGHEDHLGALPYVLPELDVPVYGTGFTLALLGAKLTEFPNVHATLKAMKDREAFTLGGFTIDPLPVTHSIIGACALAITCDVGTVIHTGDFKLDHEPPDGRITDIAGLEDYGRRGVIALLSDSTNSERPGHSHGEKPVAEALHTLITEAPFRVCVTTFSSNVHRLQAIIDASAAADRKVVLCGRSVHQNVQLAVERGDLKARHGAFALPEHFNRLPRSGVTVIASGSQGEPQSSMSRIALGTHGDIRLEPGDRVIFSSRKIPGNERSVGAIINGLFRSGIEVIDDRAAQVHASGHAQNDEQRAMMDYTKPRFFVPMHGEYRHMARHAALAIQNGVPPERAFIMEDGQVLELTRRGDEVTATRREPVKAGFVFVEGRKLSDIGEVVLRDRRILSQTGVAACVAVFVEGGGLVAGPEIMTRGLVHEDERQDFLAAAEEEVRQALQRLGQADEAARSEEMRTAVRRFFRRELDKRPLVLPIIITI